MILRMTFIVLTIRKTGVKKDSESDINDRGQFIREVRKFAVDRPNSR